MNGALTLPNAPGERLLFAARTDNEEMYQEVIAHPDTFDVNFQDGLGNTALHYAAGTGATTVLPELLEEAVDVDLHNRMNGNTPLHEAIEKLQDEHLRNWIGKLYFVVIESSLIGRRGTDI